MAARVRLSLCILAVAAFLVLSQQPAASQEGAFLRLGRWIGSAEEVALESAPAELRYGESRLGGFVLRENGLQERYLRDPLSKVPLRNIDAVEFNLYSSEFRSPSTIKQQFRPNQRIIGGAIDLSDSWGKVDSYSLLTDSTGSSTIVHANSAELSSRASPRKIRVTQVFKVDPELRFPIEGKHPLISKREPSFLSFIVDGNTGKEQSWVIPKEKVNYWDRLMSGRPQRLAYVEFTALESELKSPGGLKWLYGNYQGIIPEPRLIDLTNPWREAVYGKFPTFRESVVDAMKKPINAMSRGATTAKDAFVQLAEVADSLLDHSVMKHAPFTAASVISIRLYGQPGIGGSGWDCKSVEYLVNAASGHLRSYSIVLASHDGNGNDDNHNDRTGGNDGFNYSNGWNPETREMLDLQTRALPISALFPKLQSDQREDEDNEK